MGESQRANSLQLLSQTKLTHYLADLSLHFVK